MFQGFMLVHNPGVAAAIEQLSRDSRMVELIRSMERFPSSYELIRQINSLNPDVLFLELTRWEQARSLVKSIRKHGAPVTIIGVGDDDLAEREEALRQEGVHALLLDPALESFQRALDTAFHRAKAETFPNLAVFLPAKAGCGATTLALTTTGYLAELLDREVLYIEGDLRTGIASFLMNQKPAQSVQEALENSGALGYAQIRNYVQRVRGAGERGHVDLLLAKREQRQWKPVWPSAYLLLRAAAGRYERMVADLPDTLDEATGEFARRAASVYLVVSNELTSLNLARERLEDLERFGVPAERVEVVLNRWHPAGMGLEAVERALRRPVHASFHEDFPAAYAASVGGGYIDPETPLGRSVWSFVMRMAGVDRGESLPRPKLGLADWLPLKMKPRPLL
jgi:MinD-like ATPase involved in chromosome partitioning or flagellar assembly